MTYGVGAAATTMKNHHQASGPPGGGGGGGSATSSMDSTTGSCISCTCLMIIFVFLSFGLSVMNLWMHVHRYDDLTQRVIMLEQELNRSLPLSYSQSTHQHSNKASLVARGGKFVTEDEYRQGILNLQVTQDLTKDRLLDEVRNNITVLANHVRDFLNISSSAKLNSDKVMGIVRNIKATFGPSIDGLSRKLGYFDDFRNRTNEHFEILHDIVTKVKTKEDELERTQAANNLYLETLNGEIKALAGKSRDLQHTSEKIQNQLYNSVPGEVETTRQELLAVYDDLSQRINRMEAVAASLAEKEETLEMRSEMTATSSVSRDELDLAIRRIKASLSQTIGVSMNDSLSHLEERMTRETDQISLETIEKNMKMEQRIDGIANNYTKSYQDFKAQVSKIDDEVLDNQEQLKHFIRLAVKMSKTLPKEIESLKKQIESLGAYF